MHPQYDRKINEDEALAVLTLASPVQIALWCVPIAVIIFGIAYLIKRYRRCPSNRILVVYGKVRGQRAAQCLHGGGKLVIPLVQDYAYLSLEPLTIEIDLTSALSKKNIRVNVPSTFTIGISTEPVIMNNAAERLLGLTEREINDQARDIILGQLRLVIATLSIEEINQDREKFLDLVNKNVDMELNKIGLQVINVNIRDITDESGYIEALGRKAASEAINQAKVEVAEADRSGEIGQATANRDQEVQVAQQLAEAAMGRKQAERDQRVAVAQYEAEGVSGEANSKRQQEIVVAEQTAVSVQGKKNAEAEQRVRVAELEATAVEGENQSKANIADYEATLEQRRAEAKRRGEVALANASRDVLTAEKDEELARLEKTEVAQKTIDKRKVEIDAEAEAERKRRIARGDADAILARYNAEAEGTLAVLTAKADGYLKLLDSVGEKKELAPTLLVIEKLPDLIAEQVKAIQNLKIDKITVWDSPGHGDGEQGSTARFLSSLIGSLPPMHELAGQAGIELPEILGSLNGAPASKPAGGGSDGSRSTGPRPVSPNDWTTPVDPNKGDGGANR
ncbi:MAG: flotillin [Planctomycetaceae bacterium]|nr:flotillin [Planctomycetaceae bacterium]